MERVFGDRVRQPRHHACDGRFIFRYQFLNRLQEVWRVISDGDPVGDQEKMAVLQQGSLNLAPKDV